MRRVLVVGVRWPLGCDRGWGAHGRARNRQPFDGPVPVVAPRRRGRRRAVQPFGRDRRGRSRRPVRRLFARVTAPMDVAIDDRETWRDAVDVANIPTLLMVLVQLTG